MGKHEVVRPNSTERVRKHREAMRAKGYKLKQRWVIDMDDPDVRKRIRRECEAIAEFERKYPEDVAWLNEWSAHAWDDLPEYKWE